MRTASEIVTDVEGRAPQRAGDGRGHFADLNGIWFGRAPGNVNVTDALLITTDDESE